MQRATSPWRFAPKLGFLIAAIVLLAQPAVGRNPNPGVAPIKSSPHGMSYSQWAQAWWTWLISIPADQNPALDTTGQFANLGQDQKVFFLAGTLFGGTFERDVTVPPGTALFFPVVNAVFWAPDDLDDAAFFAEQAGLDPTTMTDEELIRFIVNLSMDDPANLQVTIDGKPLRDLASYRAESDPFELIDTDLIDTLGGEISHPNSAIADGYWLMLNPLAPGQHTIHIVSELDQGPFAGTSNDITYHLTVSNGK
jgi:hypothetical protein